jgi:phosphoribosylformylglycinamidine (FGAM) synthase-like amidotransferase family enzyme
MAKRQIHIWLDEADFEVYEQEGKKLLGIDNGASKIIKAELVKQALFKRGASKKFVPGDECTDVMAVFRNIE